MGDIAEDPKCSDDLAQFFIQYTCEQSEDLQKFKYEVLAKASALIMFSALFFSRIVNYLKSTSKLDQMEQDANTITAGDFTVEMNISHDMWDKF
jgi:hypothetical protein